MRPIRRVSLAVCAAALSAVGAAMPAHAGNPDSGTLKPGVVLKWSGGPLTGTAPSQRNTTCVLGVNCDDFNLDIEVPADAFPAPQKPIVSISLTTTAPNDIRLIVSKPGSDNGVGSQDYTVFGATAQMASPQKGVWRIRAACYVCAGASYTAEAKVIVFSPPALESQGSFAWHNVTLSGNGEGEPNIVADPRDGTLYVNAPASGANGAGVVWRSDDNGKTFKRVGDGVDSVQPQITGDTDLYVAPDDGTVYFANLTYTAFTNFVYASTNKGENWSGPAIAGSDSDRQWLATAPNGVVYLAYHDSTQMWMWRSTDHGATFTSVSNFNLAGDSWSKTICGNHMTRPLVDPHDPNTIYMLYSTADVVGCWTADPAGEDHYLKEIWLAKTTDGGTTWTQKQVYASEHTTDHNLSAATIDPAGNLYMAFSEAGAVERLKGERIERYVDGLPDPDAAVEASPGEEELSTHIRLLVSKDKGESWTKPILVDALPDHHSNVFATIAVGDPGRVGLAWYTSRAGNFDDGNATWTVAFASSADALSATPHFTQTRVSPGIVHIGAICQSGLACTVSGYNRNLLDFMGVAIGKDGAANVIYNNDTSGATLLEFGHQTLGPLAKAAAAPKPKPKPKPVVQGRRETLPSTGLDSGIVSAAMLIALSLIGRRTLRAR